MESQLSATIFLLVLLLGACLCCGETNPRRYGPFEVEGTKGVGTFKVVVKQGVQDGKDVITLFSKSIEQPHDGHWRSLLEVTESEDKDDLDTTLEETTITETEEENKKTEQVKEKMLEAKAQDGDKKGDTAKGDGTKAVKMEEDAVRKEKSEFNQKGKSGVKKDEVRPLTKLKLDNMGKTEEEDEDSEVDAERKTEDEFSISDHTHKNGAKKERSKFDSKSKILESEEKIEESKAEGESRTEDEDSTFNEKHKTRLRRYGSKTGNKTETEKKKTEFKATDIINMAEKKKSEIISEDETEQKREESEDDGENRAEQESSILDKKSNIESKRDRSTSDIESKRETKKEASRPANKIKVEGLSDDKAKTEEKKESETDGNSKTEENNESEADGESQTEAGESLLDDERKMEPKKKGSKFGNKSIMVTKTETTAKIKMEENKEDLTSEDGGKPGKSEESEDEGENKIEGGSESIKMPKPKSKQEGSKLSIRKKAENMTREHEAIDKITKEGNEKLDEGKLEKNMESKSDGKSRTPAKKIRPIDANKSKRTRKEDTKFMDKKMEEDKDNLESDDNGILRTKKVETTSDEASKAERKQEEVKPDNKSMMPVKKVGAKFVEEGKEKEAADEVNSAEEGRSEDKPESMEGKMVEREENMNGKKATRESGAIGNSGIMDNTKTFEEAQQPPLTKEKDGKSIEGEDLDATADLDLDDEGYGDFTSMVTSLPSKFQETAGHVAGHVMPQVRALSGQSKMAIDQMNQKITDSFLPLIGKPYAPIVASVVSYGLLLLPLALVVFLCERMRAILPLQKVLLFVNIYLAAYFGILLLSSFALGAEPMAFFFKYSQSNYVVLQLLQALGYMVYLVLQIADVIIACSAGSIFAKVSASLQLAVAVLVSLHYYVTVFHRAMAGKAPHTSGIFYGYYSLAFLVLCLLGRIQRGKKEYVPVGDLTTDKKN